MSEFISTHDAKESLVRQIVKQAQREGISLSELEQKMLYFSEAGCTIPDIWEVNTAFEREYDQAEYEKKIAGLIREFRKYARQNSVNELASWDAATRLLRKEDHYLLVMVDLATSPSLGQPQSGESRGKRLIKLVVLGVAGFLICSLLLFGYVWLRN